MRFSKQNLIYLPYLLILCQGINSLLDQIIYVIILWIMVINFRNERNYIFLPMYIFFYSQMVLGGNIVLFRIYTIIYIINCLTKGISKKLNLEIIIYISLAFYYMSVVSFKSLSVSISLIIDITFIYIYFKEMLYNVDNKEQFYKLFIYSNIISIIYGIINGERGITAIVEVNSKILNLNRFTGSFIDPNYLGFFTNLSIILVIILIKNKKIKIITLLILYIGLIGTMSITGIVVNIIFINLILIYKYKMKGIIINGIILVVIGSVYNYSLKNDIYLISDFNHRIESKFEAISTGDKGGILSERDEIWKMNVNYFENQSDIKKLIGGNFISDYGIDNNFKRVSHQIYIDILINWGYLGLSVFSIFLILKLKSLYKKYMRNKKEIYLVNILILFVWIIYGFSISMFPGWYFIMFLFL
ncbi:MAG: hypothetical protein ACRDAU_12290 [Clostridium sp.]